MEAVLVQILQRYASCLVTFLARITKCHIDQCFVLCAAQLRCDATELHTEKLQVKLMENKLMQKQVAQNTRKQQNPT